MKKDPLCRRWLLFIPVSLACALYAGGGVLEAEGTGSGRQETVMSGGFTQAASPDGIWVSIGGLARAGHTAVYDPAGDRMVIFGGVNGCGDFDFRDVWVLSMAGTAFWTTLVPAGTPPEPRSGHSAVYDPARQRILIYGGESQGIYLDEVWALSLGPAPSWTLLTPSGTPPPGRTGPAAIYDPVRDRMLIFGGSGSPGNWLTDLWELTLDGAPAWHPLLPSGVPPPAFESLAVYDPPADRMVVITKPPCSYFGCLPAAAWSLGLGDPPAWAPIVAGGDAPYLGANRSIVYDPVRHGVVVGASWTLTLGPSPVWGSLLAPTEPVPCPAGCSTILDPVRDRLVNFGGGFPFPGGGCNLEAPLSEAAWEFPLDGGSGWVAMTALGEPHAPAFRSQHTAVYDSLRGRLILFGGLGGAPLSSGVASLNDVWGLALENDRWSQLAPSGAAPSPRWGHTAIYDPVRDRMIVFGGDDGTPRLDTWALWLGDDVAWTEIAPAGTPALAGPGFITSVYDPVEDRMIVTDGRDAWALVLDGAPVWTEIPLAGASPAPGFQGTAVYDPARRQVLYAGGESPGGRCYGTQNNNVSALSLGTAPAWTVLSPQGSTRPAARGGEAAIYDPVRDRMVTFGGGWTFTCDCAGCFGCVSPDYFTETWALDLATDPMWTELSPAGRACRMDAGALQVDGDPLRLPAVYDPRRDRMIVTRGQITSALVWNEPLLAASVDLDPGVINLRSRGMWITAYLETSEFDLGDIDVTSVRLAGSVAAEPRFAAVDDRDGNGTPDLMLKFPRDAVTPLLRPGMNRLEVAGTLQTGERFSGEAWVRVLGTVRR